MSCTPGGGLLLFQGFLQPVPAGGAEYLEFLEAGILHLGGIIEGMGGLPSAWARTTARPGLMTASLIRRAGAWSWEPCRAGRLVPRKLWLSYAGSIGGRSMPLPGGVVIRPRMPKTWSKGFLNT